MRNWKRYSSVARDGEKTVYCEKGKHSVYYGNAFISFKPSKLIWCEDCKNTYYEVKPTLFDTQEVNEMDIENQRRAELDLLNANSHERFIYPVEFEIVKVSQDGQVYVNCNRCMGTGCHSFNVKDGEMCLKCKGSKIMLDPLMTEPQIKFIRQLFKSVRDKMTIDEQQELIDIMKSAINKTKRVNKFWASQTIDNLKSLQTERSAS